jgi:cytoskeleton protein RodZ
VNINSNQSSKLAEIGAQLKQTRELKLMSLHQVTAKTLIPERHLRAIEEGNLDSLPEPIYIQGFIRKYGDAVGLGGLAEDFPVSNHETTLKNWSSSPAAELRPLHLYALYILIIAGAVGALASFLNPLSNNNRVTEGQANISPSAQVSPTTGQGKQNSSPKETFGPLAAKPHSVNSNNPNNPKSPQSSDSWADFSNLVSASKSSSNSSNFSFPGNKPVNVGIAMTNQSWLRVTVDNKIDFEGILSEGTRKSWSANQSIIVRAGNAAAVSVTFNQSPTKALGAEGEVVQEVFDSKHQATASSNNDIADHTSTDETSQPTQPTQTAQTPQ